MNDVEARIFVKEHLSQRAIILQIAEESAELASAASKLVRVMDRENPCPVSEEEAIENVLKEYGDVLNCMDVFDATDALSIRCERTKKLVRWAERILEKPKEKQNDQKRDT